MKKNPGKVYYSVAALLFTALLGLVYAAKPDKKPAEVTLEKDTMMWYISYEGETDDDTVRIDESQQTDQMFGQRTIHLESRKNQFIWITGCDADMDGVWDRIFWNRYDEKRSGCNSYTRNSENQWVYVPCDGDATSDPIPEAEIGWTISKFREAMEEVRGIPNIRQVLTYKSQVYLEAPKNRPGHTSF